MFSLQGRAAPGLYVLGWALTIPAVAILAFILGTAPAPGLALYLIAVGSIAALALGSMAAAGAQALQRRADGWQGYWGPSPWLVIVALISATIVVQVLVELVLRLVHVDPESPAGVLILLIVYLPMYAGIVHVVVVAPGALTWAEIRRPKRFAETRPAIAPELGPYADGRERRRSDVLGDLAWGIALLAVTIPATILALDAAIAILGNPPVVSPLPATSSQTGRLLNLISAALVAPIGEEIFFRGFATNAWARTLPLRRAIIQGALLFAFIHVLGQSPSSDAGTALRSAGIAFIGRVPVAIALGWIYLRRGSLFASMAHHAGYNAFLTLIAWSVTAV